MADELAVATLARLRDCLDSSAFDTLVVGVPENVAYATGYRSVAGGIFRTHRMAAVVTGDRLVLVAPASDAGAITETQVDEHVPFGRFFFESTDATDAIGGFADRHSGFTEALAFAAGLLIGNVGVDAGIGPEQRRGMAAMSRVAAVEDADAWMRKIRSVKLGGEVERLAGAARLAETGITAAIDAARSGATERELAGIVAGVMVSGGATPRFSVVTSGERSALSDAWATERELAPGDLVRFDVGCVLDGYWSDVGRTAVVGEPDGLQAGRYAAILAGEEAQLREIGPGVAAGRLFDVAVEAVEAAGLRPYRRHHCGHGIGSEVYEEPIVAPGVDTRLEPGMVFCLETPFYELGWGGMMVEDAVLITEGGHRLLTHADRKLRVIPV